MSQQDASRRPEMDTVKNSGRRKLMAALGIGGALAAARWSKPLVDSIVLPAHAQASPAPTPTPGPTPAPTPSATPGTH